MNDHIFNDGERALNASVRDSIVYSTELGLVSWLQEVRRLGGSDLLLVSGQPPTVRTMDRLMPLTTEPLKPQDIENAVSPFLSDVARKRFSSGNTIDIAFSCGELGRFRANLHRERMPPAAS